VESKVRVFVTDGGIALASGFLEATAILDPHVSERIFNEPGLTVGLFLPDIF
jgi:hypothetical protein